MLQKVKARVFFSTSTFLTFSLLELVYFAIISDVFASYRNAVQTNTRKIYNAGQK